MLNYRPLGSTPEDNRLDRLVPDDFKHVEKYPFSAIRPETVEKVEKTLVLPWWHWSHDQGREGSCVGHGTAMERAITNTAQNRLLAILRPTRRYNPIWIWNEAKKVDEWPDTNPGDDNGTSVRAGYDVLRAQGAQRVVGMRLVNEIPTPYRPGAVELDAGVSANRWATSVDEIRTAIASGTPVTIGVNWYSDFDSPHSKFGTRDWWIADGGIKGRIRGGHCVCLYGVSDRRQAFKVKNSWGRGYPLVWLPYSVMSRLLAEDGEAAISTDR